MRIVVDYNDSNTAQNILEIVRASYVPEFKIQIEFNDQHREIIDFKPFLEKSQHPDIQKYLNESEFLKFKIEDGNLNWNDYDLIFPLSDLYSNTI